MMPNIICLFIYKNIFYNEYLTYAYQGTSVEHNEPLVVVVVNVVLTIRI